MDKIFLKLKMRFAKRVCGGRNVSGRKNLFPVRQPLEWSFTCFWKFRSVSRASFYLQGVNIPRVRLVILNGLPQNLVVWIQCRSSYLGKTWRCPKPSGFGSRQERLLWKRMPPEKTFLFVQETGLNGSRRPNKDRRVIEAPDLEGNQG